MALRNEIIRWMEKNGTKGFTNKEIKQVFQNPDFDKTYLSLKRRGSRLGFMVFVKPKWYVI